ncbi:hypothetical protein [Croceibacter atlanticus]|jgi:hypothetical protein|uniref:Uncharacterized protein n=1 Tax=Croceibacter atlanticus (strain ATCC BAA-628 / JCM 21780 / CIP 108009 / IAM 15332 / KCTC 12090 / HTCC2559) TaxID=216432 RepID=A3U4I9_CROAH|nr:hypothetical protein [Croceibacter atlanticus]EAP87156.1 hypothetical protein CA2559_00335 [Croceibacter atlanticus HTCC2559]
MKRIINKIFEIPLIIPIRIALFLLVTLLSYKFLTFFSSEYKFDAKELLNLLISTISIIIAIIITYLFSKLFSEKAERIQRKAEIDTLSHKITAFRKMAFQIRGFSEFWKFGNNNIKSKMDHKYNDLAYEDLRNDRFTYEELTPIIRDVGETAIQSYLGLKGLENEENTFGFFQSFNPKNYTLDEIARFKDYANSFWYLLNRSDSNIVNLNRENRYSLNFIDELYFEITAKKIDQSNYNKEIEELFGHFDTDIFHKHFYLSKLNSTALPQVYITSLLNMLIFIALVIASLVVFIADFNSLTRYISTILVVSIFIANTIDLTIITVSALKSELNVKAFYRI